MIMTRAESIISICEDKIITIAIHNPGTFESFYKHADIIGFELWDIPSNDPILRNKKLYSNYVDIFKNIIILDKKYFRVFNDSKRKVSYELNRISRIYIPDNVWIKLKIYNPRKDQIVFMQCLYLLHKYYNISLMGMPNSKLINLMQGV